ncbi:MAG: SDR family NAD(P)-dependent oxidoreductase [Chloroflexota bacterium]
MAEQYILLTGGHSGIGLGVTKKLLQPGNRLGLIIRSEARKQQVRSAFNPFPADLVEAIDFFYADLSDQAQIKRVAREINEKWPHIDRLFNNAAVLGSGRQTSKQGNELHLEVNALAPYLLTSELRPLLLNSDDAKVITTVTTGMANRKLRTDQILNAGYKRGPMLYMQSKQAVLLLMNELAADMQGVRFLAVDPGPNKTSMTTGDGAPGIMKFIARLFFNDPEVGTQRIYDAGFDSRFADANGVYITGDKIVDIKNGLTGQDKKALLAGIQA